MPLSQQEIDFYLNKKYTVPMEIYEDAPIPQSNGFYSELLRATNEGFSFTTRELLHAIGCKTAALPMNDTDSCLKAAYLYFHVLDFNAEKISFKPDIESDFQTARSQDIGIGVTCLIANRFFNINWDQLGPIPGRGKRFDYRAPIGNGNEGRAIFEAKGTKYFHNQISQISHGIEKKEAHHNRGEHFDVELIISTHIGIKGDEPRILIADPNFKINDLAFSPKSNEFYKYRHYARVLQYIGAPNISREYYLTSQEILNQISQKMLGQTPQEILDQISYEERKQIEPKNQNNIFVNDTEFIGQWFDYWIPPESKRYKKLLENKKLEFREKYNIKIFQGIDKRIFNMLLNNNLEEINLLTWAECRKYTNTDEGVGVSVFPDSTILAVKIKD